jgi:hypothetical protein
MNFSGRIFIGMSLHLPYHLISHRLVGVIADYSKNRLGLRRAYCISLVAFLFLSSQIAVSFVSDVRHLYIASAMLGFAYGGLFGDLPLLPSPQPR